LIVRVGGAFVRGVGALISVALVASHAFAASPCYQWQGWDGDPGPYFGPWENSVNAAAVDVFQYCMNNPNACGSGANCPPAGPGTTCDTWAYTYFGTFPSYNETITFVSHDTLGQAHNLFFAAGLSVRNNPVGTCQVYVTAKPPAQCPTCNGVGDPLDPGSGALYTTERDLGETAGPLEFRRFYNSTNANSLGNLAVGWRHSYERSVAPRYGGTGYAGPYVVATYNSSLYNDEPTACTSGFNEIKSQVSTWANATATYAGGQCLVTIGSTVIAMLPILYSSYPTPDPGGVVLIGYDATRDDGLLVSFWLNGGAITPPPSIALRLQQVSGGYTLTDERDSVEAYDANGRLLSITSRGGVAQTMGYDGAGRLSTVTDTFGHRLSLAYDSQGRLSSATLQ
jgi:YD repeat-containing protein